MHHAGQTVIENLRVSRTAKVPAEASDYAQQKIGPLAKYAPATVESAEVRLTTTADRRTEPLIVAHVQLSVNGTGVHAEAEAGTYTEAIDLLHDRVHSQLLRMHH
ncbi:HPF/RaiA family ribosome-associated protein [Umezawaea sp. Da 62-37]|uniref:HPF/RaiA family ribosome-associated protein n=1 Tax=Umezawaea sp. Da 62-37 TaxID=3075927 RepID=UPI0028F734EC|nr:HPF/RaiA family ribosome-associated protein [Umezawaea sp. Da 62-37]WNV84846.1 HPF/RaiA family ribosome-associated protein [Umezawaea sp. Da 62-37]